MKKIMFSVLVLMFACHSAFALDLGQAKSQGLVGETPSGYLEVVDGRGSAEAQAVVSDINSKRQAEYRSIAAKNGTSQAAVEQLAGAKAIERTAAGQFVKINGRWQKK